MAHTSGFPEPEVTWFKNASAIHEDERIRITQDDGIHTLMVEQANEEDSGQYAIQLKNDKGRQIRSFVVNVVRSDDEKTVVQEMVPVHEVSEKVLKGTVDELGSSMTLEAKEGREADLREKLEEAEKLIVVDTTVQKDGETDKTKKQKKKEVTVKKEVVTVHKVEDQVLEDGQVVREIRETVSSSELESGADVGLTEDSLRKLEPFVMMENRIQKPKIRGEESDEEVEEEIIEVKKEVNIVHQVQERYGDQGDILDAAEVVSPSEAKEMLESGVKAEKLEEVEKLIVIDNAAILMRDEDASSKKRKPKIKPKENEDSPDKSDVKPEQRAEIAVEETVTISEIPGKPRGIIAVEENAQVLALAPKPQPKKSWLESQSDTESDVESDVEPQTKIKSGDVISDVTEDVEQKLGTTEQLKKPWEESETESDTEPDEDYRTRENETKT